MDRDRRIRLYDVHSWTGISLGLFLFAVCFSGSVAMFHQELHSWEDPANRLPPTQEPVAADPLFNRLADGIPVDQIVFATLWLPTTYEPWYRGVLAHSPPEGEMVTLERRWNPSNGEVLRHRGDGAAHFIFDLHRDLAWPDLLGGRTIGRGIVGIMGVVMLLSIISGIFTHRKILREFFTLRTRRTLRVQWKDAHNVLGTWTLPFSIVIAFTGAWLGAVTLLLPLTGALVFKGDTAQVLDLVAPGVGERSGPAPMLDFDALAQRPHSKTGALPINIVVQNWGDSNIRYTLNYPPGGTLRYYDVETVDARGESLPLTGTLEPMAATRVIAAVPALHYGTFGGLALKYLYFALGIALSAMVALGNMVWIERRWHSAEGQRSPVFYRRLSNVTIGLSLGFVVACVGVFYADFLYRGVEDSRYAFIAVSFFILWMAGLAAALLVNHGYRSVRGLLFASGIGLLGLPLFSAAQSGLAPWSHLAQGHRAAPAVDLTLVLLGVLLLLVTSRLPRQRPQRRGSSFWQGAANGDSESMSRS